MKKIAILITVILLPPLITIGQSQNWTKLDDFDGVGRLGAFSFVINNKGYVGTGVSNNGQKLKDFWEYDPVTDFWEQKQDASGIPRVFAVGFAIGNKGYMGAGDIGSSGNFVSSNDFYEYDPVMNVWTIKQNIGSTGRQNATAFVIGSKAYVALGYRDDYIYDHTVYEYDPSTDIWTQKESFDSDKLRESPASFTINGKAYVAGGYNNTSLYGTYYKDIWEYNPLSDSWTFKAVFPSDVIITEPIGFSSGNHGYIFGDDISANSDVNFLKYDPSSNTISILPNHPNEFVYPTGLSLCEFAYSVTGSNGREVWRRFLPEISISGSSLICTSGSTFTLNNLPPGFSVTWQATPSNLFAVSSGTGNNATLSAANSTVSGQGTITFTINNACGTPVQVSNQFWVGKRKPTGFISVIVDPWLGRIKAKVEPVPDATGYEWYLNGVKYTGPGMNSDYVTMPIPRNNCTISDYSIGVKAMNACGTSSGYFELHPNPCYEGGYYYSYFPNPSSETLTIESNNRYITENNKENSFPTNDSQSKHYYRFYEFTSNQVVLEGKLSDKTEIDVSKLRKGKYILKIQIGKDKDETHQIIVD